MSILRELSRPPSLPPLENGDRLSLSEFKRRYDAMPELKKAELIDGVVFVGSPVRATVHARQDQQLNAWLAYYRASTLGVDGGANPSVELPSDQMVQPDGALWIAPECGGRTRIDACYVIGAPELMAEVAASSVSRDLHVKRDAYEAAGVREYLVWRVYDEEVDVFALRGGRYERVQADLGVLKSAVFPGLWLDVPALLRDDLRTVLRRLDEGLATPEHAEFVKRLETMRA